MSCTPVLSQIAFRIRNDDGNETTATWVAAENTNGSFAVDTNLRIRLGIQVTNACAAANAVFQLQYSRNGGTFTDVTASSVVARSSASPNLADAANTTDQFTAGTGTFLGATCFDEVDGAAGGASLDIAASGQTQVEYCVQIRKADVWNGDVIEFRVTNANLASWTQTPDVTVTGGNDILPNFGGRQM
jgi:hypothetical protein